MSVFFTIVPRDLNIYTQKENVENTSAVGKLFRLKQRK